MAKDLEPGGPEGIHDARGQGGFRTHYGEVHLVLQRKGLEAFHVGVFQRHVESLLPDAGIAGGAVNLFNLGGTAERVHYGMFAPAAANHQNCFPQTVFQLDFLTRLGNLLGRKRINKTHIISV